MPPAPDADGALPPRIGGCGGPASEPGTYTPDGPRGSSRGEWLATDGWRSGMAPSAMELAGDSGGDGRPWWPTKDRSPTKDWSAPLIDGAPPPGKRGDANSPPAPIDLKFPTSDGAGECDREEAPPWWLRRGLLCRKEWSLFFFHMRSTTLWPLAPLLFGILQIMPAGRGGAW